jgi:hypothetical protein
MRRLTVASRPPTVCAYTRWSTATEWPAHVATCVESTPAASHVETAVWRRSYGRAVRGWRAGLA